MATINRGLAYESLHDYDNALADYRKAIDLQPEEAISYLNFIALYTLMRKTPEAEEHARTFLNKHPDSLLAKYSLAYVLDSQKQYQEAYQLTSEIIPRLENSTNTDELKRIPKDILFALVYSSHALASAGLGKTDEASLAIQKAASYRNDFDISYSKAKIHYIQKNWQQAVNELNSGYIRATSQEKNSPWGIESKFLLGNSYFKLEDMAKARTAYEDFLLVNKYEPEAFFNLGQVYAKLGEDQKAIDSYTSAIRLNKFVEESLVNRGSLYLKQEKYNDAIADFSEVLAKQPTNSNVLYKRAYSYCMSANPSMAKPDLKTLLNSDPGNSQAKKLAHQCVKN